jgi:hypothetical protein
MPKPGDQQPSNAEIAERMRAFKFAEMNLSFKDDEINLPASKQIKRLHSPLWVRVIGGLTGLVSLLGIPLLFPRGQVLDWVWKQYGLFIGIWILAICIAVTALAIEGRYTDRRWQLFANANELEVLKYGVSLPGDLRTNRGTSLGFRLNTFAGRNVSFGICDGWFDKESKWPVGGYSAGESVESILFVRVELPTFSGPSRYFGPRRPLEFSSLPAMSEKAEIALTSLAARYSVVVGQGSIIVSHAKSSGVSVTESLEYIDLSLDSLWMLFSKLISGKLADIVEGVN